ncbi:hypothetical protein [Paenibacillus pedocola]|uniref:hypothetical protein n=1 Tax=Paenibacillus pedocola TaxID=3242193 RepID=UPI002877DFFA|nr:hypothetical protein [Paenibacillus typhae]
MGFYTNTPWAIYVSIVAIIFIILIVFVVRNASTEPKEYILGLILLSLSCIAAAAYKMIDSSKAFYRMLINEFKLKI